MAEVKLGKVTTTPKGEWASDASYERLDIVQQNGSSWMAKRANTGVEPVEGDDWMLSSEGAPQIDDTVVNSKNPWSSKNIIDRICPEITATGNPVVLEDCVEGYPMDVEASWDIQQKGEGDPHLEGYGTNKFRAYAEDTTYEKSGLTFEYTAETETIHISGTNTSTSSVWLIYDTSGKQTPAFAQPRIEDIFAAGNTITMSRSEAAAIADIYVNFVYKVGTEDSWSYKNAWLGGTNQSKTFTLPDDVLSFYAIQIGISVGATDIDVTFQFQVELGSAATAWTKYAANIRPFVGKDSVTVKSYSENLFQNENESIARWVNYLGVYNGYGNGHWAYEPVPVGRLGKAGDTLTYQFYVDLSTANSGCSISTAVWYLNTKGYKGNHIDASNSKIITSGNKGIASANYKIPDDAVSLCFGVYVNFQNRSSGYVKEAMVSRGSDVKTYVPYEETVTTIQLPETVYAGNVTNGGTVCRTRAILPLSRLDESNVYNAKYNWFGIYVGTGSSYVVNVSHLSDTFKTMDWSSISKMKKIYEPVLWYAGVSFGIAIPKKMLGLADDYAAESVSEAVTIFQNWLSTLETMPKVEALLATPTTLTVDPATIPVLEGANTILTDADALTVTARKDPIKTITNLTDRISALEAAATEISEV